LNNLYLHNTIDIKKKKVDQWRLTDMGL